MVAEAQVTGVSQQDGSESTHVPELLAGPCLLLRVGRHRGDGIRPERWLRSSLRQFGLSISSLMLKDGRWRLLSTWFYGQDGGGGWPASSFPSATSLVKGRPYLFLPACAPNGRQFQLLPGCLGLQLLQPWRPRRPKWCVPGDGDVNPEQILSWTRSRFPHPVRGPFCKKPGAWLLFPVSVGFLCKMYCPFLILI